MPEMCTNTLSTLNGVAFKTKVAGELSVVMLLLAVHISITLQKLLCILCNMLMRTMAGLCLRSEIRWRRN